MQDEPEKGALKLRRRLVIIPDHDNHHGRLKDSNAGANSGVAQIITRLEVQREIPQGEIRLDSGRSEAVRLLFSGQEGQRLGENIPSTNGWVFARSIDAPYLPATHGRNTQDATPKTELFSNDLHPRRSSIAGPDRQRPSAAFWTGHSAYFRKAL